MAASALLDAVGRLLSSWLQFTGHSCGIADLVLTPSAEVQRRKLLVEAKEHVVMSARAFLAERDAEAKAKALATGQAAEASSAGDSGREAVPEGGPGGTSARLTASEKRAVQQALGRLLSRGREGAAACAALDSELQVSSFT